MLRAGPAVIPASLHATCSHLHAATPAPPCGIRPLNILATSQILAARPAQVIHMWERHRKGSWATAALDKASCL